MALLISKISSWWPAAFSNGSLFPQYKPLIYAHRTIKSLYPKIGDNTMKIKTGLFLLTFFIVSSLSLSTAFAQYEPHMQMGLPEGAKVRFGTGQLTSRTIAYSPNMTDSLLAVVGKIGIWLYDAETLQPLDLLTGPMNTVNDMSFSPDGGTLAVGQINGTVDLWDVATRTLRKTLTPDPTVAFQDESGSWHNLRNRLDCDVESLSFSPDGSILAVGTDNGTIELWNTAKGELHKIFAEHHDTLNKRSLNVSFSPDGTTLASATLVRRVHLWDVATGELRKTLGKYGGGDSWGSQNASFSPDGSTLATYNTHDTLLLWDVATGELLKTFENLPELINHINISDNIIFSPDGNTIVTLTNNTDSYTQALYLWDVATGTLRNTIPFYWIMGMSFSPDGNTLAATNFNTVFLLDINTGKLRGTIKGSSLNSTSLISPDGRTLAIGNLLWDISTGTLRNTLKWVGYESLSYSPTGNVHSMSFSPDGSILATGSGNRPYVASNYPNWVYLWDVSTGTFRNILKGHTATVMSVSFSPDGNTIASGSVYVPPIDYELEADIHILNPNLELQRKGELLFWDVATGQQKNNFNEHFGNIYSISFNFDGSSLAVGSDNKVYLLDADTGAVSKIFQHVGNVYSVSFSPDGSILATGSDDNVRLWDVTTGTLRKTFDTILYKHKPNIRSVKFSHDGSTLAASIYSTVHLWDVATGTLSSVLKGHTGYVESISFGPDGSTLASGSGDGTVLLWEIGVPKQLKEDINGDGVVNIQDLVMVASQFGQTGENKADVNEDGVVNIQDLVLVAAAFSNASAAPTITFDASKHLTPEVMQQWIDAAKQLARTDPTAQRGIAVLETLLAALTPKKTALLPNYPNPFNPETWIPYQLAKRVDVSITIYSADGKLVRILKLGQQAAGVYESRSRAAYWDGKNEVGESVASGVYLYTLKAGDFTTTRKMLIRK